MSNYNVNPNVSVDCVIFGFDNEHLNVLLIKRKEGDPSAKPMLALPGDLVLDSESLDDAANRVLKELTGLEGVFLNQFQAFGDPLRVKKVKDLAWLQSYREQPQARVITIGYFALVQMEEFHPSANSFAEEVYWQEIHEIPELAFDHNEILSRALDHLQGEFILNRIGYELLPEKFTLSQVQKLHEIILDKKLDKRNFRSKLIKEKLVIPLNEKQTGVVHKPAQYYKLNQKEVRRRYGT
jgi:8-oxo-dGTP diphosphatase